MVKNDKIRITLQLFAEGRFTETEREKMQDFFSGAELKEGELRVVVKARDREAKRLGIK